ncbi:MAG TPA: TetR-like C-terminal domain-containing protein, partial [Streptomyces sp.]
AQRRKPVHEAVARAVERGEIEDAEFVADLFLGPLFYRRLLSREPLSEAFVNRVVAAALAGTR